jgi:hypothetical protein
VLARNYLQASAYYLHEQGKPFNSLGHANDAASPFTKQRLDTKRKGHPSSKIKSKTTLQDAYLLHDCFEINQVSVQL